VRLQVTHGLPYVFPLHSHDVDSPSTSLAVGVDKAASVSVEVLHDDNDRVQVDSSAAVAHILCEHMGCVAPRTHSHYRKSFVKKKSFVNHSILTSIKRFDKLFLTSNRCLLI